MRAENGGSGGNSREVSSTRRSARRRRRRPPLLASFTLFAPALEQVHLNVRQDELHVSPRAALSDHVRAQGERLPQRFMSLSVSPSLLRTVATRPRSRRQRLRCTGRTRPPRADGPCSRRCR